MTKIVNSSLQHSYFHSDWKCTVVRPLLKKLGLELIQKNYRPISNLTFVSKLIEKAALQQFASHCDTYSLIPDYQSAYRKGYSCKTSVIKFVNDNLWSMENKRLLYCAFLDLRTGFDTVDHDLLLEILQKDYGIQNETLAWYYSYWRPRSMRVCIGNNYSERNNLDFSIPQGSASGAFIFIVYCASYQKVISQYDTLTLQGFADDHFLHNSFNLNDAAEVHERLKQLEYAMIDTKTWMDKMRLKMNPDKTEFMILGNQFLSANYKSKSWKLKNR